MTDNHTERPQFFEGQYLGAADLASLLNYQREQMARHSLGGHTWGISAGLQLIEVENAAGNVDVYIQPGFAWDGYGRAIVVLTPSRLPESSFSSQSSGSVKVWLRYHEVDTNTDPFGNERCDNEDYYRRVRETFTIVVGEKPQVEDRQNGVTLSGLDVEDAREALITFDENAPLICDASVPYQALPNTGDKARWLIPLGVVKWVSGSPGHFEVSGETEQKESRKLRRYTCVVAEGIYAPDGVIRFRQRFTPAVAGENIDTTCSIDRLQDDDLTYINKIVGTKDLVWVEGNLRVEGHTRLYGTRLEFLESSGDDGDVPLFLRREDNNLSENGGKDLQIIIGDASDVAGANRLAIGTVNIATDSDGNKTYGTISANLVVKDDGKVGVGTNTPESYISSANHMVLAGSSSTGLTIASGDTETGELAFADGELGRAREAGFLRYDHYKDSLCLGTLGIIRLTIDTNGKVGIGTAEPDEALHVKADDPDLKLDMTSSSHFPFIDIQFALNGSVQSRVYWNKSDGKLYLQNAGTDTLTLAGADVGIGTDSPKKRLDVRGSIAMGPTGELFAIGGMLDYRIVAGSVTSAGEFTPNQGYTSSKSNTGQYQVNFTFNFSAPPVVTATLVDPLADGNVINVRNVTSSDFEVYIKDIKDTGGTAPQDSAFNFIACGTR